MSFLGETRIAAEQQHREHRQQLNGRKSIVRRLGTLGSYDDDESSEKEDAEGEEKNESWSEWLVNEWTCTFVLFLFSLTVILGKLWLHYDFFGFLDIDLNKFNQTMPMYKEITDKVIVQPMHKYCWLIKAVFTGLGVTGISWFILYQDSNIPGVNPPSPFSPSKKRIHQNSSRLELNYFVGGLIGFLMFLYMCL